MVIHLFMTICSFCYCDYCFIIITVISIIIIATIITNIISIMSFTFALFSLFCPENFFKSFFVYYYQFYLLAFMLKTHISFMLTYILRPTCSCDIWALCVSWITYEYLHDTPCLTCWALFFSLVPEMCTCASCAQVHAVLWHSHCGEG